MYPDDERPHSGFGGQMIKEGNEAGPEQSEHSIATASEDRILTEELNSQDDNDEVNDGDLDKGNIIQTVKMDAYKIKRQMPGNLNLAKNINKNQHDYAVSEQSDVEAYKESLLTPKRGYGEMPDATYRSLEEADSVSEAIQTESVKESIAATAVSDQLAEIERQSKQSSKKVAKKPFEEEATPKNTRTIKRTVFFQGAAFIIEEEVSINSDEFASVRTSEDDFVVEDEKIKASHTEKIE